MSLEEVLKSQTPQGVELKIDKILASLDEALRPDQVVAVDGETYTVAALREKLLACKALFARPRELRAEQRRAVEARRKDGPGVQGFLVELQKGLECRLGTKSPALEKLGFRQKKKARALTVEEKLRRAAKARLTRQMRGTLGRRQKEKVKAREAPVIVVEAPREGLVPETPGDAGVRAPLSAHELEPRRDGGS